ncbi:hypothetical protein Lser_V15G06366 [Lactuca serriola]
MKTNRNLEDDMFTVHSILITVHAFAVYNVHQLKLVIENWFDKNGGIGSGGSGGGHRGRKGFGRCGGSYGGGGRRSSAEVGDTVAPRAGVHNGKHGRVIGIEEGGGSTCGSEVKRRRGGPGDGGGGHDDHSGFSGGDVKRSKVL